jgi:hypothetical protein
MMQCACNDLEPCEEDVNRQGSKQTKLPGGTSLFHGFVMGIWEERCHIGMKSHYYCYDFCGAGDQIQGLLHASMKLSLRYTSSSEKLFLLVYYLTYFKCIFSCQLFFSWPHV